ncbi:hypothetical protein A3D72_00390 [Candidatus Uhrbacteria bacterium RIFCSPHIGHO2_02_FULL_57_19]|uniref:Uncharacterized protein n=1 Tax=Candidatus Uhrbacteria bacterium RIFCSPHIGHO2_02_FULL_57_19 TaxID=1802391 RepID=A0A1F7U6S2_9BACT|nr:MAG: hypothetical protein A3D72_00390 [Candidatus Uhrbacteria bacterium RIFCSPHIGHO2_02_FULL_57_19]
MSDNNTRGNVLLLSLLVLSGIMLGGVTIGDLVLRSIRSAKQTDAAAVAYYAAESGAEDALYHLRKTEQPPAEHANFSLDNGASVERVTVSGEPVIYASIVKDSFIEFNLFDKGDLAQPSGVEALRFSWDDECGGASSMELSYAEWTPGAAVLWPDTFAKFRFSHAVSPVTHTAFRAADRSYRVRLQAGGCDAQNMTVSSFSDDAATLPKDIPSRLTITSTATYGGTEQALLVRAPPDSPLSGIFDFAVFSECSIDKDGVPACP